MRIQINIEVTPASAERMVRSIDYARGKLNILGNPRDGFADAVLSDFANAIEAAIDGKNYDGPYRPDDAAAGGPFPIAGIDDDEGEDH